MFVGIDVGGTNIGGAAGDREGRVLTERSVPTQAYEGPSAVIKRIAAFAQEVAGGTPQAIGIGLPGTLDRSSGVVRFLPNLPTNWRGVPVGEPLSQTLGCPVYLLNDARLATLGELDYGAGRGVGTFALLTLGTGIGGGVVIDGRLRLGPIGAAGEVGHQTILPDGPPCGCGNRGCLETLASGPALTGDGVRILRSGMAPKLFELTGGEASRVTPKELAQAARAGDSHVTAIIERAAGYLAIAIGNLINVLHPELVLLTGGVAEMDEVLLNPLRRQVIARVGMFPADGVIIKRSALAGRAGVLGGIALAVRGGAI
jgi:glucokinase